MRYRWWDLRPAHQQRTVCSSFDSVQNITNDLFLRHIVSPFPQRRQDPQTAHPRPRYLDVYLRQRRSHRPSHVSLRECQPLRCRCHITLPAERGHLPFTRPAVLRLRLFGAPELNAEVCRQYQHGLRLHHDRTLRLQHFPSRSPGRHLPTRQYRLQRSMGIFDNPRWYLGGVSS
jgi:hypothetical protein